MQSVSEIKTYISTILGIVILAASLLPALHAFDHDLLALENDPAVSMELSKTSVDCQLCDFHLTNANAPAICTYELLSPQKESVYSISLAETVNLFPKPLFSLRAPPVVIS